MPREDRGIDMRYTLEGLSCAGCATRLEQELHKVKGLEEATINFASQSIELPPELLPQAREIIARIEPGVKILDSPGDRPEPSVVIILLAGLFMATGLILNWLFSRTPYLWVGYISFLSSYFLAGWRVLAKAWRNLIRGRVFDENFLMTIATLGAVSIRQLPEAATVMLLYAIGEYFQERAVNESRRSIAALLDFRPEYANLILEGKTKRVRPEEVEVGQVIAVKPGERVPLDGEVMDGVSFVDTSAITGEAVPRKVEKGAKILAGMINGQGMLTVKVTRPSGESTVARILDMVENAAACKSPTELFITSFSRYYTPVVVLGAAALAVIPPVVLPGADFSTWVYRALVLLVISCPCALVISIPLGYFGGIGAASRQGILVKGANFLDALKDLHTVAFDKTGTLTRGVFKVTRVVPAGGFKEKELLEIAAAAEIYSDHPIARSIRAAYGQDIDPERVSAYREIPGLGISAVVDGKKILAGNERLMHSEGIAPNINTAGGTVIYVAVGGVFAGYLVIADELKPGAAAAVAGLKNLGVKRIALLTGDEEAVARKVAGELGIDTYFAELLPEDKVARLEELQSSLPDQGFKLAFVGDGINDAPVITRADIGIAMGGLGREVAVEAADVVLIDDDPAKLVRALEISRYTNRIMKQNVALALGVKAFFLGLGAFGVATIWEAVFADVGVTLLAITNATRTLKYGAGLE